MKAHVPLIAIALGLVFSANKCTGDGAASTAAAAATMQGKWALAILNGQAPVMPHGTEAPYFTLDSTGTRLRGFAGCNRMFGPLAVHGDSISFAGLASTRMYCKDSQAVEDSFLKALRSASTFTLKDGRLTLLSAGKEVAVLVKEK